jgi:tetratricopeptide (TPR) repeat protein
MLAGLATATIVVLACLWFWGVPNYLAHTSTPQSARPKSAVEYVGSQTCASCHPAEHRAWQGSHHQLAMQAATRATVLAPFQGERFTTEGVTSVFSQHEGRFYVRTDGPDGRMQDFEISHTFGLTPLQQYLVPMPNGGMQVLGIAWDARAHEKGGQRWFHLHAGEPIRAGDELHWTGRQSNWNFMCAECHTTRFKKNFNPETRRYQSSWSEMNVACEACHGPGSDHITWAHQVAAERQTDSGIGLLLRFDERKNAYWSISSNSANAVRSKTPDTDRKETEMCARCHSHRSQISDDYIHGKPLLDTHIPSVLSTDLFWSDGQMKAEVFNYASFQQSTMYKKGVTCSDCHEPHSLKLKAPGHQVCFQCHASTTYETPTHHFHKPGSAGAGCPACHMPTTTYMSVDPRHDHSMRVPRPDLHLKTDAPNACTKCHIEKSKQWAAQWSQRWYPLLHKRVNPLTDALMAGAARAPDAPSLLLKIITDPTQSGIARASALARLPADLGPTQWERISAQLIDRDPLVRRAAVEALSGASVDLRVRVLRPVLGDPVKGVRISAARWLAGLPTQEWSAQDQARLSAATREYMDIQLFNADRPEAYNNLGTLHADQHEWLKAEAMLKKAIELEPGLAISSLNLADVYREQGREEEAQALIRKVIHQHPDNAAAHHALGLSQLRKQGHKDALSALRQAMRLEPHNPRFAYVYAAVLENTGQRKQAVQVLEGVVKTQRADRQTLQALIVFCGRLPDQACVQHYAKLLIQMDSDHLR